MYPEIIKFVCENYHIKKRQLLSQRRDKKFSFPRQVCMYLLRRKGMTLTDVGQVFLRDHSTVMHALAKEDVKNEAENLIAELPFNSDEIFPSHLPKEINDSEILYPVVTKFPHKYAWLFKKRDPKCQICGFDDVIEVHHIISPKKGGKNTTTNILILCPNHHSLIHAGLLKFKNDLSTTDQLLSTELSTALPTQKKD